MPGHFAVLTAPQRGIDDSGGLPRYGASWMIGN